MRRQFYVGVENEHNQGVKELTGFLQCHHPSRPFEYWCCDVGESLCKEDNTKKQKSPTDFETIRRDWNEVRTYSVIDDKIPKHISEY